MASTNQINKVVESIAVLGDLIILNLCLFVLLFFLEEGMSVFTFFLYGLFYDDFVKSLLFGLF